MSEKKTFNASCSTLGTFDIEEDVPSCYSSEFECSEVQDAQLLLSFREERDRRAVVAIISVSLFLVIVLFSALVPAITVTKYSGGPLLYKTKLIHDQASVVLRLHPVNGLLAPLEQAALIKATTDFFSLEMTELLEVFCQIASQELIQGSPSMFDPEGDMASFLEVVLRVEAERSSFSQTPQLEATDLAYAVTVKESTLRTLLYASNHRSLQNIEQVIASTTTYADQQRLPTAEPITTEDLPVRGQVDPTACNGLVNLCNMKANEILYGTMHNANFDRTVNELEPNHNYGILAGLRAGMRGINVDLGYCGGGDKKKLSLVHTSCALGYSAPFPVFTQIQQFLTDHPREVIVMPIELNDHIGHRRVRLEDVELLLRQVVDSNGKSMYDRIYQHPVFDPHRPRRHTWPTLNELIDRDHRIILGVYHTGDSVNGDTTTTAGMEDTTTSTTIGNTNLPALFLDWLLYATETDFEFSRVEQVFQDETCGRTRGVHGMQDFLVVNHFLRLPSMESSARLNEKSALQARLVQCAQQDSVSFSQHYYGSAYPNLLVVDFFATGDVLEVVEEYNAGLF